MSIKNSSNCTRQLAIDHVVEEYRRTVVVAAAECPPERFYGFDSAGWDLFVVIDQVGVGSSQYVAVHKESGEARSLGRFGE